MVANPSEDIGATRDIVPVIQGGVVLDRSTLVFDEAGDRGFRTVGSLFRELIEMGLARL